MTEEVVIRVRCIRNNRKGLEPIKQESNKLKTTFTERMRKSWNVASEPKVMKQESNKLKTMFTERMRKSWNVASEPKVISTSKSASSMNIDTSSKQSTQS